MWQQTDKLLIAIEILSRTCMRHILYELHINLIIIKLNF